MQRLIITIYLYMCVFYSITPDVMQLKKPIHIKTKPNQTKPNKTSENN